MNKLMIVILLAVILPSAAAAQNNERWGQGYGFVAPTVFIGEGSALHFGGGAEARVYKGIGIGGEVGYLGSSRDLSRGLGVFSINGSYNFQRSEEISPFVTGGPTLAFANEVGGVVMNLGGGLHWWFKDRVGLRLEVRDYFTPQSGSSHALSFRIGLAFR